MFNISAMQVPGTVGVNGPTGPIGTPGVSPIASGSISPSKLTSLHPCIGDIWSITDHTGKKFEYELTAYDPTKDIWTTIDPVKPNAAPVLLYTNDLMYMKWERNKLIQFHIIAGPPISSASFYGLTITGVPLVDKNKYPHTCSRCKEPAYIGFNSIDCSNKSCGQEVTISV